MTNEKYQALRHHFTARAIITSPPSFTRRPFPITAFIILAISLIAFLWSVWK